jgi:hypothetical protein
LRVSGYELRVKGFNYSHFINFNKRWSDPPAERIMVFASLRFFK